MPEAVSTLARPRTTGEILDDAWRLALAEAPWLLLFSGCGLVPLFCVLLLLLTRPEPESLPARLALPALAALLVPLTGLGSAACQELFRRRAEAKPVEAGGCVRAALRQFVAHGAVRTGLAAGILLGLGCLLLPGLALWSACATAHAALVAAPNRPLAALRDLGRDARFDAARAAAVTLGRLPLFLVAALNLHLLLQVGLWTAGHLAGLDVAFVSFQLSLSSGAYVATLLMLAWLLLAPFAEASNFLLHLDMRTRQEGLDLLYRVQRAFPGGGNARALLALLAGLSLAAPASAEPVEPSRRPQGQAAAVRAGREELRQVTAEVREAEPYPGGGRWLGRLEGVARRLELSGGAARFGWFRRGLDGFAARGRQNALEVLAALDDRLALLEEALPEPAAEANRPSAEELRRLLRSPPEDGPEPAARREKPEKPPEKREDVRRDNPGPRARNEGPAAEGAGPPLELGQTGWLLLGGVLAALLAAGVVFWLRRRRPATEPRRTAGVKGPAAVEPAPHEQPAALLWRRAEELARSGAFLEAVRGLFRAVLSLLHARGLLHYQPTRTNGEYLREVRLAPQAPPSLHEPFARLTRFFEGKWYGERDCDAAGYDACHRLAEEVRTLATTG
jgi:hypothetical protein